MTDKSTSPFQQLSVSLLSLAALLAWMHVLGELHGVITTLIILCGSSALAMARMAVQQRELARVRQVKRHRGTHEADQTW